MKTVRAPRKTVCRSTASVPALVLLGTLSGTALAATDVQQPCPDENYAKHLLLEQLEQEAAAIAQTVEATETITARPLVEAPAEVSESDPEEREAVEKTETADYTTPEFTSSLPGVSVNDLPGFRRHMYRTDI